MEKVYYTLNVDTGKRLSKIYQRKHHADKCTAVHALYKNGFKKTVERELICPERHRELLEAEAKLSALQAQGVDNWCGYDDAMSSLRGEDEE